MQLQVKNIGGFLANNIHIKKDFFIDIMNKYCDWYGFASDIFIDLAEEETSLVLLDEEHNIIGFSLCGLDYEDNRIKFSFLWIDEGYRNTVAAHTLIKETVQKTPRGANIYVLKSNLSFQYKNYLQDNGSHHFYVIDKEQALKDVGN